MRQQHLTQAYAADVLLSLPVIGCAIEPQQLVRALQYNLASRRKAVSPL